MRTGSRKVLRFAFGTAMLASMSFGATQAMAARPAADAARFCSPTQFACDCGNGTAICNVPNPADCPRLCGWG